LLTQIEVTVPEQGALISFSIFIASKITTGSPSLTVAPLATLISRTVPGIGDSTFVPAPADGAGAAAGAGARLELEQKLLVLKKHLFLQPVHHMLCH